MGVGLERMLGDRFSAQLLFNRFGFDASDTDGRAGQTNALVLEARFYFDKHRKETINKASFLGLFAECSWTRIEPSVEGVEEDVVYLNGQRNLFAPGLVIGRNVRISERFYLEFYTWAKSIVSGVKPVTDWFFKYPRRELSSMGNWDLEVASILVFGLVDVHFADIWATLVLVQILSRRFIIGLSK